MGRDQITKHQQRWFPDMTARAEHLNANFLGLIAMCALYTSPFAWFIFMLVNGDVIK